MNLLRIAARLAADPYAVKLGDKVDLKDLTREQLEDFGNKLRRRGLTLVHQSTTPEKESYLIIEEKRESLWPRDRE